MKLVSFRGPIPFESYLTEDKRREMSLILLYYNRVPRDHSEELVKRGFVSRQSLLSSISISITKRRSQTYARVVSQHTVQQIKYLITNITFIFSGDEA